MSSTMIPQERFDSLYITGNEIQNDLKVQRSTVIQASHRGLLPAPIILVGAGTFLWERDVAKPFIEAWKINLTARRGELSRGKTA